MVFFDQFSIGADGALIGVCVHLRLFPAEALDELGVNCAVLRGQLCGRVRGLTRANLLRLEDEHTAAALLKIQRRQDARHSAADHGNFRFRVAVERRPRGRGAGFLPKRFHNPSSLFS